MPDELRSARGPLAEPDGTGNGRDAGETYDARTKPKTADPGSASGLPVHRSFSIDAPIGVSLADWEHLRLGGSINRGRQHV